MKSKQLKNSGLLALTALIWGVAFVAQSVGMDYMGPFTFNAVRFMLGGVVLVPCMFLIRRINREDHLIRPDQLKAGIIGGGLCGLGLFAGSILQQFGIMHTTVGKAGFITSLYILIVPLMGLFLHKKAPVKIWVSVAVAMAGMYMLCVTEGLRIGRGDFYVFLGAIAFSIHILIIDYVSPKASGVFLSCIQFFTAGAISGILMLIFETPRISDITAAWIPVLYAGIMSCGVAYTLQVVAQKYVNPVVACLILSLESVFSLLAGWVLLKQVLSARELFGCVLVFSAIVLAQIPEKRVMPKNRDSEIVKTEA